MSTAVTEEALSQCLNRSTYQSRHAENTSAGSSEGSSEYEDGVKCCICQVCLYQLFVLNLLLYYKVRIQKGKTATNQPLFIISLVLRMDLMRLLKDLNSRN